MEGGFIYEEYNRETWAFFDSANSKYEEGKALYIRWQGNRQLTIQILRSIATEIQQRETKHRVGQMMYSTAGVSGGAMALGSLLAAPFTAGLSLGLMLAGTATGVASGVAGITHSSINSKYVQAEIAKVTELLKEDEEQKSELVSKIDELESLVLLIDQRIHGNWNWFSMATQGCSVGAKSFRLLRATNALGKIGTLLSLGKVTGNLAPSVVKGAVGGVTKISSKLMGPLIVVGFLADIASLSENVKAYNADALCEQSHHLWEIAETMEKEIDIFDAYFSNDSGVGVDYPESGANIEYLQSGVDSDYQYPEETIFEKDRWVI